MPYDEDPEMTAAISFDEATIYISDGFLKDPDTFYQLNVLMRHELAHYLMQHQIRMMHKIIEKYGKDGGTRISMSQSLHHLMNIILTSTINIIIRAILISISTEIWM